METYFVILIDDHGFPNPIVDENGLLILFGSDGEIILHMTQKHKNSQFEIFEIGNGHYYDMR